MIRAAALLGVLSMACAPKAPPPPTTAEALAVRPAPGPAPAFAPAAPEVWETGDGITVWLVPRPELPLVSLRLILEGGSVLDPREHPGLTALADTLLMHGAGERDATAFAEVTERLAIDLDVGTSRRHTTFELDCHADRLDEGLGLMADAMLRPRFDDDAVQRVREQRVGALKQALDSPGAVASTVAWARYFGAAHPMGHSPSGTVDGVQDLDAGALKASWSSRLSPDRAQLVVAGAIDKPTLSALLDKHLGGLTAGELASIPEITPPPPIVDGPRLILVDNPGASQSVLRVLLPGWSAQDEERLAGELGGIVLGGTFTSRLNRLLREEKGYTYGARTSLGYGPEWGATIAHTAVFADKTGPALADLIAELERARSGITPEELAKSIGAKRTGAVEAMASRAGISGTFAALAMDRRGPDALQRDLSALAGTDTAAVSAALSSLDLSASLVVVVGDLAAVRPAVEAALPGDWMVVSPLGTEVDQPTQ